MAAIFFLFLDAKKLPKNPPLASPIESMVGLFERTGVVAAGIGLPVLGSTCTGFAALCRSFTMAIA